MLNLASPEPNSTGCQTSSKACKRSAAVGFCRQRQETAAKSIFSPKRDLGKVILLHDLFILFLHGTKRSDVYTVRSAVYTQAEREEKYLKTSSRPALHRHRMDQGDVWQRFRSSPASSDEKEAAPS